MTERKARTTATAVIQGALRHWKLMRTAVVGARALRFPTLATKTETSRGWGTREFLRADPLGIAEEERRIPFGNDREKSKDNSSRRSLDCARDDSAREREIPTGRGSPRWGAGVPGGARESQ